MTRVPSFLLFALLGAAGCDKDDVGTPCGTEPNPIGDNPIANENPVSEVVRMERDGTCRSFQCLRHLGVNPYCTRTCTYSKPGDAKACASDADCSSPNHCFEGVCQDDDCPAGFECRGVQETGPLAGELFCVYKVGCETNRDCENLGDIECKQFGCASSCVLAGEDPETCRGALECRAPFDDTFECVCAQGGAECDDTNLSCKLPESPAFWPDGSVTRTTMCIPN